MRKQGSMRRARSRGSHYQMVTMMMSGMLRTRVRIRRFLGLCRDLMTLSDRAGLAIQWAPQVGVPPESVCPRGVKSEASPCHHGQRSGLPVHRSY
jgi:hypothetical protein